MTTTPRTLTALLLLAMLFGPVAATEVYKWTDADGGVHYGQQGPPGASAERVTLHHDDETDAEAKAKLDALMKQAGLGAAPAQTTEAQQPEVTAEPTGKELAAKCARAAEALKKFQNWAKRLLVTDSNGTPSVIDSVQRTATIDRIEDWMSANKCY